MITNRKSHTRFRLISKSMTLDDVERPLRTVSQYIFGAHHEHLNEDIPHYRRQKCSTWTLVSDDADIRGIFQRRCIKGRRGQKRQLLCFQSVCLRNFYRYGHSYYIVPHWLYSDPKIDDWNDPEWPLYVKFCFRAGMSRAESRGFRSLTALTLVVNIGEF